MRDSVGISFSAKYDKWGMEWRARTDFPLATYQAKWESLKKKASGGSTGASHSASVRISDVLTLSPPEAEFRLKRLAMEYLESNPGPDEAAKNIALHSRARFLLRGKKYSNQELERIAGSLRYRLESIMDQATKYIRRLKLNFPDCREVDIYQCKSNIRSDTKKRAMYQEAYNVVLDEKLFDRPEAHEGMPYIKGTEYVRVALVESGLNHQQIRSAAKELVSLRGAFH